jgi:DNA-binding winged helix-turn-helix (wHTH) protein
MMLMTTDTAAPDAARQPIGATPPADLRIGDWVLDAQASRLHRGRRGGRREARLEPKVADLLIYLAEHPRQVVSRQELEAAVWRGTVVGYDSVTGAVQKLRRALEDDRRHPRYIETLSKRGYRLIAPVQPVPSDDDRAESDADDAVPRARARWASWKLWLDVLWLLLLIALAAAGLWLSRGQPTRTESIGTGAPVTIAVLPLGNLGAEAEMAEFVDALTDATGPNRGGQPPVTVIAVDTRFLDAPGAAASGATAAAAAEGDRNAASGPGRPGLPTSHYNLKLGQVYYVLGRYADAAAAFRRGLASDPVSEQLHVWLAASLAAAGDLGEARWEAEQVLLANPDFTLGQMETGFRDGGASWMPRLVEGLREAGFPR